MKLSAAFVVGTGLLSLAAGQAPTAAPWNFVEHQVATGLRGGYQVVATDINKDGKTDLLAVATGAKVDLVWFENPTWTPHVMASGFPAMINADAFDTDKDGYPEVVLQSGFSTTPAKGDGVMTLLTKGADVNAPWQAKEFDRMPSVHRVRWIDAEGNGRKMVVNGPLAGVAGAPPDYKDKVSIYAYALPDLKRQTVTDADEGVLHGLQIVDWDGKGREALLGASFMGIHLYRYNGGKWQGTKSHRGESRTVAEKRIERCRGAAHQGRPPARRHRTVAWQSGGCLPRQGRYPRRPHDH